MRTTIANRFNESINSIQRHSRQMADEQVRISGGTKLLRASDSPLAMGKAVDLRTTVTYAGGGGGASYGTGGTGGTGGGGNGVTGNNSNTGGAGTVNTGSGGGGASAGTGGNGGSGIVIIKINQ